MSPETLKKIRYEEHDAMWAPERSHQGPWQIYQPKPNVPRLVWAYKRETVNGVEHEKTSYAGELE